MWRLLRRLSVGAAVLLGVWALLWGAARLMGPTALQGAAVAALQMPPVPEGRNAFDLLWLLHYDVPAGQRARVVEEDVRRIQASLQSGELDRDRKGAEAVYQSVAEGRYPDQTPSKEDLELFCRTKEPCLDKVLAAPERYESLVARHATLIARVDELPAFDFHASRIGYRSDTPAPRMALIHLPLTRDALMFAQGKRQEALNKVCGSIRQWRRLSASSDWLVARVVTLNLGTRGYARLLADMLDRMPVDAEPPAICREALAPPTGLEWSLCPAMRTEFAFVQSTMSRRALNPSDAPVIDWIISVPLTQAAMAEPLAQHCGDKADQAMKADRPFSSAPMDATSRWFQCLGNPAGCVLLGVSAQSGAYDVYARKVQDGQAIYRLVVLWQRLRAQPQTHRSSVGERLQMMAAQEGLGGRQVSVSPDGQQLRMSLFDAQRDAFFALPLPQAMRQHRKK